MKKKIIQYLLDTYHPTSIMLYGSYANGTNNQNSDFDCLIIVDKALKAHDSSVIEGVELDCFIKTKDEIQSTNIDEFTNVFDAEIVLDDGFGTKLQKNVLAYIEDNRVSSIEDKEFIHRWVLKSIKRFERHDDESSFRGVMMLSESLEDYCLFRDMFYHGPKKTILYLKENDSIGYDLFHQAMKKPSEEAVSNWMKYVIQMD